MMVKPYVDWQVTDDWLLKFGGAFMYSHLEQNTREPYTEKGDGLQHYFDTSRHYYECFVGEPRTFEIGIRGKF